MIAGHDWLRSCSIYRPCTAAASEDIDIRQPRMDGWLVASVSLGSMQEQGRRKRGGEHRQARPRLCAAGRMRVPWEPRVSQRCVGPLKGGAAVHALPAASLPHRRCARHEWLVNVPTSQALPPTPPDHRGLCSGGKVVSGDPASQSRKYAVGDLLFVVWVRACVRAACVYARKLGGSVRGREESYSGWDCCVVSVVRDRSGKQAGAFSFPEN